MIKEKLNFKNISVKLCVVLFLIFFVVACVPQGNKKNVSDTSTRDKKTTRENTNTNSRTSNSRTNTANNRNNEKEQVLDSDSINIARLAASAVNKKTAKPTTKSSSTSAQIDKRKDLLKDVTDEKERFIDTTYYMLKMEDGQTEILSNINLAGGASQEFYENLIRSFVNAVAESEKADVFDCTVFKIYANQFNFNDSLQQEAMFYFAECCISNDNLIEAAATLEELCKEKMNRGIAPKIFVRLGQVYCIMGEKAKASKYFKRLKKEFPRSPYNQLADCGRL